MIAESVTTSKKKSLKKNGKLFSICHATSVYGAATITYAAIGSFFSPYMTDIMKIPAAAASAIMLIATLWDAINDPIMGIVADRTKSKLGRYRPYFLFAPILLMIFSVLLWVNPNFSIKGKIIWVLITYIGYGMTVTMYTMPQMAVLPACIKDTETRNKVVTLGAAACAIAFIIGNTFTPVITEFFEQDLGFNNGYIPYMVCCGILAFVSFWGLFITTEEKYLQPVEDSSITKNLKLILKHKELFPNIIAWFMASAGYGMMFASSVYYMMYYYERPDLISVYMGVISVGALVSMVVLMPIFLKILKTGQKAIIASQSLSMICYIILFFFGKSNFTLLCVITFLSTCFSAMQNALINVLVNDSIDYIQYKEGISANGIISSIKGFAQKCGNTVVNSGILAVLAATGYVAGKIGEQPEITMFALNFMKFGVPCITGIILIICVKFNPVEKYEKEIEVMKSNMENNI